MATRLTRAPLAALLAVVLAVAACGGPEAPEPPEGVLSSAAARERGRASYLEHCAICHGVDADGRGIREHALSGPPRDFTDPSWRGATTPGEAFTVVREGVRGTSMPSWRSLSVEETWDLVAYLWSVGADAARHGPA